uniref:Uncharacterized protein n=1 Tax=viral metagenome TaxID=1070528 RepID=A0A2V0R9X8_9ZZZZ
MKIVILSYCTISKTGEPTFDVGLLEIDSPVHKFGVIVENVEQGELRFRLVDENNLAVERSRFKTKSAAPKETVAQLVTWLQGRVSSIVQVVRESELNRLPKMQP